MYHESVSSDGSTSQKTSIPPPTTPKRTAHPVARMLAERPEAPPLLPLEEELEGDGEPEDLVVREDSLEATLEALDWTEVADERTEEAGKNKVNKQIQKRK